MSFATRDPAPTLEMKMAFISAAKPGRIVATGTEMKAGRTFRFVEAVVRDTDGKLLAPASATVQQISMPKLQSARRERISARLLGVEAV